MVEIEGLKILLAVEPRWTISRNGLEFQTVRSNEISVEGQLIRIGNWTRTIDRVDWLRPNVVRLKTRQRFRTKAFDTLTLYPGERLPPTIDLRRRRRQFQAQLSRALTQHFNTRSIQKQTLYSDRRHGIGGAYPRFLIGNRAVIAVDPDEPSCTVNAIMRAALLWSSMIRRRVSVIVPQNRAVTLQSRLRVMDELREMFDWLQWDGEKVTTLPIPVGLAETQVHTFSPLNVESEVARIVASLSQHVQPVLNVANRAISIRFRGIEIAQVREGETTYPLGEPLARAHEERWLESNLVGQLDRLLPTLDPRHVYPQVPSFIGEDRNIIDILTVTKSGRLVVMEIKASADPDLPFQALDYWIAVEKHRKAGDFQRKGYFESVQLQDEPALLVLVAPLLAFHKTLQRLVSVFPAEVPLMQIGLNQTWKTEIKILRRQGLVG